MGRQRNSGRRQINVDRVFDVVNLLIMLVVLVIFVWPLWFVVAASISDPAAVWQGKVVLFPKGFTLDAYAEVIKYKSIWTGYLNTIIYTVLGTLINMVLTVCAAYPLSRKDFVPRNFFMFLFMLTMYFSGGVVPTYIVVNKLHLVNTMWAMIIPNAVSIFNIIITRTYFINSIPGELYEAAQLDGANSAQYLVRVVLPLSKPILAVILLFYAVGHWNDFYSALLYVNDEALEPLQTVLRRILFTTQMTLQMNSSMSADEIIRRTQLSQTLKYSSIIVSTLPILCVYPFVQKYFVKGIMIGSVKG
ncbi:MAG: carbohydrate ABC transporter permease [Candidatus Limivivens sp.]|nr:carbohydrate ABC transporter permease [Candidatus Limivivens sp.]